MSVHVSLSDSSRRKCAACLEKFNGRIFYDLKFEAFSMLRLWHWYLEYKVVWFLNILEMKKWEKRFIKEEKKIIRKEMLNATYSKILMLKI